MTRNPIPTLTRRTQAAILSAVMAKVRCKDCRHFLQAPYEARVDGCYLEKNMASKQDAAYLDEQQTPGDHRELNRRGDCPDFEARRRKLGFFDWLMSESA